MPHRNFAAKKSAAGEVDNFSRNSVLITFVVLAPEYPKWIRACGTQCSLTSLCSSCKIVFGGVVTEMKSWLSKLEDLSPPLPTQLKFLYLLADKTPQELLNI